MKHEILIVDDEKDIREQLSGILEDEGYSVRACGDGEKALDALSQGTPDLIVLDVWLGDPKYDDLKLLEMIIGMELPCPILMISGHGSIETAVKAIKLGAYDFVEKPFQVDRLLMLAKRAIDSMKLVLENKALKLDSRYNDALIGTSSAVHQLRKTIERVAPVNSRVMLTGPYGSGKSLIAKIIHAASLRCDGPYIVCNCDGDEEEIETRLFGSRTESDSTIGAFEQAHTGTLYLEDVNCLSKPLQSKLVKVLHDNSFTRINSDQRIRVNVRVIASSRCDLKSVVDTGEFREDLYYRLNIVPISVPSLYEHREDIPELLDYFSKSFCEFENIKLRTFSAPAMGLLQNYNWPGNVQELRILVERMMLLNHAANDEDVTLEELPSELRGGNVVLQPVEDLLCLPLREAREQFEKEYLLAQVNKFSGNISRTASFIGMERSALHRKLRHLQLERGEKGFGT